MNGVGTPVIIGGTWNWPDEFVQNNPAGLDNTVTESCALALDDGRVLYMWADGADITRGWAPTIDEFWTVEECVTDIEVVATMSDAFPGMSISKVPDYADHLMIVGNRPDIELWSSSDDGDTWSFTTTIHAGSSGIENEENHQFIGQIHETSGGAWLVPAYSYSLVLGAIQAWTLRIFRSTDDGSSWTSVFAQNYNTGGVSGAFGVSRRMGFFGSNWYATAAGEALPGNGDVIEGSADGATWSSVSGTPNARDCAVYILADDNGLYDIRHNGGITSSASLPEGLYISDGVDWTIPEGATHLSDNWNLLHSGVQIPERIIVDLGDADSDGVANMGLLHGGLVWRFPSVNPGWVVGRVTMGGPPTY